MKLNGSCTSFCILKICFTSCPWGGKPNSAIYKKCPNLLFLCSQSGKHAAAQEHCISFTFILGKKVSMLSDQRVSEPVFENTAFLLYINPPYFNLFQLLNMACWAVQSCINASVEEPRPFMRDDVCNTTDSCRDHNLETVYHLFWLSSQTKGKALLIPNIQPLACQGTCGLQFKKPVCSSAVFLVWYFWFIRKSFVPFKDMEKWANGTSWSSGKKKILYLRRNNCMHTL